MNESALSETLANIPESGCAAFRTVSQAYRTQLRLTYEQPDPVAVPGRRERLGVSFSVREPVQRLVLVPARRANVIFNFAEVLWYLANRDDLAYLAYYAPGIRRWSKNGRTMTGSAYGRRFFSYGKQSLNQWETVVRTLTAKPLATRAVMQVLDPAELLLDDDLDYACTLAFQFLAREGHLHCFVFMRANDAFLGAANDIFAFTFVQEMLARQLGIEVGHYHHNVGSYHTIDEHNQRIEAVLADRWDEHRDGEPESLRFPSLPPGDNWPAVRGPGRRDSLAGAGGRGHIAIEKRLRPDGRE